MERGDDEVSRLHKLAKPSSGLSINQNDNSSNFNNNLNDNHNTTDNGSNTTNSNITPPPSIAVREQDQYMPLANVIRIMRRILPPYAKISDDAKETIQECVSEYISFITSEANEHCHREQRKTVTAEDVVWAMGKLGFDNYVEPLTIFLTRYRESENDRTSVRGDAYLKRGIDCGRTMMPPFSGLAYRMGFQQGVLDTTTAHAAMSGYFRDSLGAAAGSSSQASLTNNFDTFGKFKRER